MHSIQRSVCFAHAFTAGLVLMFASGCGGGSDAVEGPTGTVFGTINYKGAAIPEGCAVTFMPEGGDLPAAGEVNSSGAFSLYFKGGTAIPTGKYKIGIMPPAVEETPQQAMERMESGGKEKEFPEVPQKYRDAETSGETFEVKEGENTYELDMKD